QTVIHGLKCKRQSSQSRAVERTKFGFDPCPRYVPVPSQVGLPARAWTVSRSADFILDCESWKWRKSAPTVPNRRLSTVADCSRINEKSKGFGLAGTSPKTSKF